MGLNQFIEAQLREKVENEWLTKEEAKKVWRQRREIRVAIRKLYQAKGDGLILEDELMFVDQVFRLCLSQEPFSVDSVALLRWFN